MAVSRHVIPTRGATEKLFYVNVGGENLPYMLQLLGFLTGGLSAPHQGGPYQGGTEPPDRNQSVFMRFHVRVVRTPPMW